MVLVNMRFLVIVFFVFSLSVSKDINIARSCELNDFVSCYNLAVKLSNDKASDSKNIDNLYIKACNGGVSHACYNLASLYTDKDEQTAKSYYLKACQLGNQSGCINYRSMVKNN